MALSRKGVCALPAMLIKRIKAGNTKRIVDFISNIIILFEIHTSSRKESVLLYSLWDGYIEKNQELQKLKALWENRFIQLHSGGHASADDIKKMVEICSKEREQTTVIPMHLENFNGLTELELPATIRNLRQSEELVLVP